MWSTGSQSLPDEHGQHDNHKVGYDHNTDSSHVCFGFVQLDKMGTFEVLM